MGVASRRRVWLVGVGGIYGCGCKEVMDIFILLIPTPLVSLFFAASQLLFSIIVTVLFLNLC